MVDGGAPVTAPIGTRDILPPESARWERLVSVFAAAMGRAGYGLLQSPMFEAVEVFRRLGEGTDVVGKEMYEFTDKGGRDLALRPEGTASAARAWLQHRPVVPWKVWYAAPSFRYERPQAGRYRQHHQLGIEAIGSADPDLDVEVIALARDLFAALGLGDVTLSINSMGDAADRDAYATELQTYLAARRGDLDEVDQARIDTHPLRVLDSPGAAGVLADAPRSIDGLSAASAKMFERVQEGLGAVGVGYVVDSRLVRGLDYYTHTTFEFQAHGIQAAQNAIGGGGRYDGLIEALGGPPTPGIGFGIGIERLLLACDAAEVFGAEHRTELVFVVDVVGGDHGRDLTVELRRAGIAADRAFDSRSMKAQMKAANRAAARLALIVGEDERSAGEVTIRDLASGEQTTAARSDVVAAVRAGLTP